MDSGRHAILPTSASDHDSYNKFSMCRSCSFRNSSIPPSRQYPCQVYMVLLLLEERDQFPNFQNTQCTITPSSYPLMVLSTTAAIVLCVAPLCTTLIVVLCRYFLSFHILILTLKRFRPASHCASNFKGVFSCMCSDKL